MGEIKALFFDTFAFIELIEGNPNYAEYTDNLVIVTTKLNLMELHYGLLRCYGEEIADRYYNKYLQFAIEVSDDILMKSSKLKYKLKKRRVSYIDCIGYSMAQSLGIKFLTGDKEFADLENVEFVK